MDEPPTAVPAPPAVWRAYSPEFAEAFCARVEAGESLVAISRDPAFPPRSTVEHWVGQNPAFARRLAEAVALVGLSPGGRPTLYSVEMAALICRRLAGGEALHRICAEPGMPANTTVVLWLRRYPEFEELYGIARDAQSERMFDRVGEIAEAATPETAQVAGVQIRAAQWQAAKLAPRKYGTRVEHNHDGGITFEVVNYPPPPGTAAE